jgi:hypothetical protein
LQEAATVKLPFLATELAADRLVVLDLDREETGDVAVDIHDADPPRGLATEGYIAT